MNSQAAPKQSTLSGTTVVVSGLGPMGRGIARVFAAAGAAVRVVDVTPEATVQGLAAIRAEADKDGASMGSITAGTLGDSVPTADLFLEAIVENMDVKRQLLQEVAQLAGPDLIVASNTSSLSIGELGTAYGTPERVVGLHFFNPPTKMRLVEVIVGAGTSPVAVDRVTGLVRSAGKEPVQCRDSPNFIVNRVCRPLYYEAQLLHTQGVEPAIVDAAASRALGHPMGPLTLLDFTGLHTHLASSETALREFGDPRYRPIPVARSLVRSGMTGRAAGRGFYNHGAEKPRAAVARVISTSSSSSSAGTVRVLGPDAGACAVPADRRTTGEQAPSIYACHRPPLVDDVAAVADLAHHGMVVVDSSDGGWLEALPTSVGWVRLHRCPDDSLFAEVVQDAVAGISAVAATDAVLDALGADRVAVPALPGLVVDRLSWTMINEAQTLVEEGIATPGDIDTALRLGMNHPWGPCERLAEIGAPVVHQGLRSMADHTGDPRYRPTQLLRRQAAGARR